MGRLKVAHLAMNTSIISSSAGFFRSQSGDEDFLLNFYVKKDFDIKIFVYQISTSLWAAKMTDLTKLL